MNTFKSFIEEKSKELNFNWLTIVDQDKEEIYSISDLLKRVNDFYKYYEQNNITKQSIILIILKESLDLYASFFAGIVYGAIPAYFAYPSPKQSTQAFVASLNNLLHYNRIDLVITFNELKSIIDNINLDKELKVASYSKVIEENIVLSQYPSLDHEESFLQFSSGTTGSKKGVKLSIPSFLNQLQAYTDIIPYKKSDVVVSWLPHYHDMGLIASMLIPFIRGTKIVMMSPFKWVANPIMLLTAISKYRGTHIWVPNFALGHLTKNINIEDLKSLDISSLKKIVCCSEPVLYKTVDDFIEKFHSVGITKELLQNCYAMAENTFAMTSTNNGIKFLEIDYSELQKNKTIKLLPNGKSISSAGYPLKNIEIKIIDDEFNRLDENSLGEVLIKSDCMLTEYHNNPQETEQAFLNGWFKTGDLGFFHDSELFIVGRKKDMIIISGENIYPQDIEEILNNEDGLIPGRNLAFGVYDDYIGTEKIVILAESNKQVDTNIIKEKIFNILNIVASDIILLPHMTLLKGTAGKISRYLNKQEFLNGKFDSYLSIKKNIDVKDVRLKSILEKLTKNKTTIEINESTNLFSSGIIDSLQFVELVLAIEKEYGIKISSTFYRTEYFKDIKTITNTINKINKVIDKPDYNNLSFFSRLKAFYATEV